MVFWRELVEAARAALEEERNERDALVRLEVEQLTGQAPKRRGRPPSTWTPESEARLEQLHREGASIRQIAAAMSPVSKTRSIAGSAACASARLTPGSALG